MRRAVLDTFLNLGLLFFVLWISGHDVLRRETLWVWFTALAVSLLFHFFNERGKALRRASRKGL